MINEKSFFGDKMNILKKQPSESKKLQIRSDPKKKFKIA